MKYFLFILLSSFLFCCNSKQTNEGKSQEETSSQTSATQTKEIKQEEETDNEALTMKKDKTIEDDLLMLKNVAFCKCLGQERFSIKKKEPNTYKLIQTKKPKKRTKRNVQNTVIYRIYGVMEKGYF